MKRIIVILIIILNTSSCGDYCEDYLKSKEVSGLISKKYIDNNDHFLNKLEITNEEGKYVLVIDEKDNIFWNFVEEGYHLSKKSGSTKFVIRKNKIEYTFDLCNN